MHENPLIKAPPRLSDLRGTELTQALNARAEQHKANWLQTRERIPLITRVMERLFS